MNIYFCGSICGGRADAEIYTQLIAHLQTYGTVLTEHVGDEAIINQRDQKLPDQEIHDRDLEWLLSSDVVIAEVTQPSLGVGYELGRAVEHEKEVLCLYRPQEGKRLSPMIAGCAAVQLREYHTLEEAKTHIAAFLEERSQDDPRQEINGLLRTPWFREPRLVSK
ncbi:MAG TPA: nucleoside 2-deoxyribosyltransferase [Candidatus Nanoarchaeia archaeon]|nr:nucleoside 2-deoxyribosyltransferase [Candidatus Nanoarchaeia archaeon]